ncbi:hypothetical protein CSA56_18135 [candidate division KSB3 bacterium]|uniref:histidine kinase n=1 Tax=candidate division KSB3 bacterium TaxID=2044937 RepID=A0A2G6K719_9BACT|nr:MAG: hypothetical protein CSA56_18135 [candidate division KSB3 bacterium]
MKSRLHAFHQRMTIKTRLIAALLLLLIVCLAGFTVYSLRRSESMIRRKELETYRFLVNTVRSAMRQKLHEAETAVQTVAQNPNIQRLFAERKREELLALLSPVYQTLKPSVSQLHFHLPDSTSFLRLHFPEEFGDNLKDYRLTVNECNTTQKLVAGLEEGIAGFGFRVVVPMNYQGRHTGSVEYGMDFGREFLLQLRQDLEGDYFIYRIVNGVVDMHLGTLDSDVCFIQGPQIEEILADQPVFKISDDRTTGFILIPFRRFNGEVQGFIKVVLDRSELARQMAQLTRSALLFGGGSIVGLTAIFFGLITLALRPIPQIVEQTKQISAEISRGNFTFRGNVKETSTDFQEIIAQINRIINALRESESQKQAILDAFPGMLYYIDRDFTILWANRTMRHIYPAIIGARCPNVMENYGQNFCKNCLVEKAIHSRRMEKDTQSYFDLFGKQETTYWENIAVPIETAAKQLRGCIKISWNITEQKRLEQLTRDLNRTLEDRIRHEIEKQKEQEQLIYQQSKLAALGELAAGIAHEINQPLNTIGFALDNLFSKFRKQTMTEDYLRTKIALLSEDIHRIRLIIDHVRTFSREQHSEHQETFDMNMSVEKALSLIRVQYANHNITVETDLSNDCLMIWGNLYHFEQVILNFLSNAKDAVEEKHSRTSLAGYEMKIHIRTYHHDNQMCLEVEDNGIGIEKSHLTQIFDPFYTTKDPDKGTGLGLSISYGLIKKMHGTLDVESRYQQGTIMRLTFSRESSKTQPFDDAFSQEFSSQKELQPLVL